ncbi:SEC-C domain-containing protein [Spirillospora sp. NPDC127200]
MEAEHHGDKAERRAREVAARLGVPDFVYGQPVIKKGKGQREVGDGLLISGTRGAIIQVKSREHGPGLRDGAAKAERLIRKSVSAAIRQGQGSIRTIQYYQQVGAPLKAIPVRALDLPEHCREKFSCELSMPCDKWPIIVIVEHPDAPSIDLDLPANVFCITLFDWEMLYRSIRSVSGVLEYVELMLGLKFPTILGHEAERFLEVCRLGTPRPQGRGPAKNLPRYSSAAIKDSLAIDLYHELISQIWEGHPEGPNLTAEEVRIITAFLDDATSSQMVEIGRWTLKKRKEFEDKGNPASGSIVFNGRMLVYLIGSAEHWPDGRNFLAELMSLALVRMHKWHEDCGIENPEVLAIGVRREEGRLGYLHLWMRELSEVPQAARSYIEWQYGVPNYRHGHIRHFKPERNSPCPCGSGKKYKRCHAQPDRATGLA